MIEKVSMPFGPCPTENNFNRREWFRKTRAEWERLVAADVDPFEAGELLGLNRDRVNSYRNVRPKPFKNLHEHRSHKKHEPKKVEPSISVDWLWDEYFKTPSGSPRATAILQQLKSMGPSLPNLELEEDEE